MSVRAFDWQAEFAKDERVTAMDQSCLTIRRWLKRAKREGNASSRDTAASATVPSAPGPNPALAEAADQSIDVKLAAATSVEPAAFAPIDSANQQIDIDMGLSDGMASTCRLRESQAGDQDVDKEEGEVLTEGSPATPSSNTVPESPSFEPLACVSETASARQHKVSAVTSATTPTMVASPSPVVETDLPRPATPGPTSSIAAPCSSMSTTEPSTHVADAQQGHTEGSDAEGSKNDCPLCKEDRDDSDSLLCDTCDQVYHTYCVGLYAVPKDDWFCPACAPTRETPSSRCAPEQLFKELQEMNGMLVHACSCDAAACTDATFSATCKPMKLALQCMSWLSFNAEIRPTSFIQLLAKLLAFHAAHCAVGDACLVPLCHTLRLQGA